MRRKLFLLIASLLMSISTMAAVKISGTVNASTLAENSDVVLTGNTNLYMDVNKTIKTLNAAYPLTISGGNILTVNNPNGDAITSDGDISISGSKLVVKAKSNGIHSANGNIMIDSKLDITVTDGYAVYAKLGNVSISKDTKIISASSTKAAIQAGYYENAAYKVGRVTIAGGTININSQYDAIKTIGGAIDITGNVTLKANGKAIFAFGFDHSQIGGQICFGNINLNGTFDIEGSEYAIAAAGGDVALLSGSIKTIGSIYTEGGDITLNGNVDVTASTNKQAIWAYGKVNITGNVKAVSEASDVPAIQAGYYENAAYQIGSVTITGGTVNVNSQYDAIKTIGGAIDITGNVTLRSNGKAIFAFGVDHSQIGGKIWFGNINLNGTFDIEGSEYAIAAGGGDVTLLSGSIKTIGSIYTAGGDITLNGNVDVTASTNKQAIWAYGKVNITGNVKAVSEASNVPAIQAGYYENAAYQIGSVTITGGTVNVNSQYDAIKAIGGAIDITGNVTLRSNGKAIFAFGVDHSQIGGKIWFGNINLNGTFDIEGSEYAIAAGGGDVTLLSGSIKTIGSIYTAGGDITLNGNVDVTASTNKQAIWAYGKVNITGNVKAVSEASNVPAIQAGYYENAAYQVGGVTITGGTVNVNSQYDAIRAIGGDIKLTGNMTITSANACALLAFAFDHTNIGGPSYSGNIIFGKGDYKLSGSTYSLYTYGQIVFPTTLVLMIPTNGKLSGNTIVDAENAPATYVHIGYTPKITQNTLSTPNTIKYGEQLLIEGKIKAIGKTTYKLQECADGSTWRTIKSGTISTLDARNGQTIQYKKVLAESGYEAFRQYRMIATYFTSGESDTTTIHKVWYKYQWVYDGQASYYIPGASISLQKPEDGMEYRISSALPVMQAKNGDYIDYTMPACNVWIDKVKTKYTVKFFNADYTLLKTEEVECGSDATPPANPTYGNYTFTGWSQDLTNVHSNMSVLAKYDIGNTYWLEALVSDHENSVFPAEGFSNSVTRAMVGDKLTFTADVFAATNASLYYETAQWDNSQQAFVWTENNGIKVADYTTPNKWNYFNQTINVAYYPNNSYINPFQYKIAFRFYMMIAGVKVFSDPVEIDVYYPLTINAPESDALFVENSAGDFNMGEQNIFIPARYNETIRVYSVNGTEGGGLSFTRGLYPSRMLDSGLDKDGNAYFICPGEQETINVAVSQKLVVFDGVYGNGYPKQLDFSAQGFGRINGYYGEIVNCGGSVTLPEDPTVENGIFTGWEAWSTDYADDAYLHVPAVSDNVIGFTAQFEYLPEVPTHTVRFYGKDGSPLLDTQVINEGEDATPPVAPTVSGWHFTGWDKDFTTVTADMDITALYGEDIKVWTVTYKNWDGSDLGSEQVNDGEAAIGVNATREGYTFVKWRDYTSGDDVDMEHITANVTVEAVFTETLHTVTYRVEGEVTYTIQVVHGFAASSIYYPHGTPTKEDTEALVYSFDYWAPNVATITEDVTFDAVFLPSPRHYTVVFQNWDHTLLDEQSVAYGTTANAPDDPTREGYVFKGWDREYNNIVADLTITALFEKPKGYITLMDNASNAETLTTYHNGAPVYVTLKDRTFFKDGNWNTLTLPFNVATLTGTPLEGATVMEMNTAKKNGFDTEIGTLYLAFKTATQIEAGKPYLVKWTSGSDIVEPVFSNVTISSTTPTAAVSTTDGLETVKMVGNYEPVDVKADDQSIMFMGNDNSLYYTTEDRTLHCFRAHFEIPSQKNALAPAHSFVIDFDGEVVTNIDDIRTDNARTVEGWYSLDGRRLDRRPTQKGIYIHNGSKVIIK